MNKVIKIAIDGPAAAGKSTVAKKIAQKLNYTYIDTGAMYRALTLKAIQMNTPFDAEVDLVKVLKNLSIKFVQISDQQHIILDGKDVTESIRAPKVTQNVSKVAQHKKVRELMVKRQQELSKTSGVVMDGRDIGTHVLPNAELKIFLVASVDERAERRYREDLSRGFSSNLQDIKAEIIKRDQEDENRTFSPLVKADDAVEINSTHLSIDEVVTKILQLVNQKII